MKKGEFQQLMTELAEALRGMDLPPGRDRPQNNDNLRWLSRNLAARNAAHAGFGAAAGVLQRLGHPIGPKERT